MSHSSGDIPTAMKAAVIDQFGAPEVMHLATIPIPEVGPGDVLIRVETAGVGAWDPALCSGEFGGEGARFPLVLGSDGEGTIAATGASARRFRVGDRVYAYGFLNPKGGFYAEYAVIPEDEVSPVPPTVAPGTAGALAADGLTALAGLELLSTGPGQTLIIFGASGGIGHLALQLAKRMGARVFAIASGDDGLDLMRRLGADAAVDGRRSDMATAAHAFAPDGFDAALTTAGGAASDRAMALVRKGGRIAYPNGVEPEPKVAEGVAAQAFDGYHGKDALERLGVLVSKGPFHVEVTRRYPLDAAGQALRDVSRHHLGKLAVDVRYGS